MHPDLQGCFQEKNMTNYTRLYDKLHEVHVRNYDKLHEVAPFQYDKLHEVFRD